MVLIRTMLITCALLLACGCPKMAQWRDNNMKAMQDAAKGSRIDAPNPPVQLPADVQNNLPIDPSWIIVSHASQPADKSDAVVALAGDDLEITAQWMIVELMRREYASHDNPSRILEGVEYGFESADLKKEAYYERLFVHVTMNTAGQVVVTLTGWQ
jgi:hypothetical protein